MAICPLVNPRFPLELRIHCFSYLDLPELDRSKTVCKEWHKMSLHNWLWTPFYTQLNPDVMYTFEGDEDIKSLVLFGLHSNQKFVDRVIALVNNDKELAYIIDYPYNSSVHFQEMLPIERTWLVMRALREDCSDFCEYLLEKNASGLNRYARDLFKEGYELHLRNELMSDFCERDPHLLLLLELIRDPPGPFDASDIVCTLVTPWPTLHIIPQKMHIFASIVKSHQNLSSFFALSMDYYEGLSDDPYWMPMSQVVREQLMPLMTNMDLGVTEDDWKACGLELRS